MEIDEEYINVELANQFTVHDRYVDKFQFNHFCDRSYHQYSIVYIVNKSGWFNNDQKISLEVSGYIFYQGEMIRNHRCIFTRPFELGTETAEILDINLGMHGKHNSRGIGTNLISTICTVLRGYGVKKVQAYLVSNDFDRKDQLYNFYINKNGFELKQELTEDSAGLVEKSLDGSCNISAYTK
ncbi:hypothetical protein [Shimazuella kribbensis]|uniref:hypothetical protein n=1 Tax=Shimazuella kribbensis TaxID=139808 RepID=UPI0004116BEA|nr:hypothetical protein [Shimazuella kribbensis]